MTKSRIEWTEETWNPITGCSKISAGCKNCYAEVMSRRLSAMGVKKYKAGFKVTIHPESLEAPFHWIKPRKVFVNSMSDIFHEDVPSEFILKIFSVMNAASTHVFQVLTKRPERLSELASQITWSSNIWMGVTVENAEVKGRITLLKNCKAKVKFLSIEPLIGPVGPLDLKHIHWVIVGGESGPGSRHMEERWVEDIFHQCKQKSVPFFFKQWGGFNKKKNGRIFHGKIWNEMPSV